MSLDTSAENKQRQDLSDLSEIWVFGYGSLIYKIDFPYLEKKPAHIFGWQRRFWQGSHDHRGTPDQPGRVATLIQSPINEHCDGIALRVEADVFEHLDHREKNGYLRHRIDLYLGTYKAPLDQKKSGIIYIAAEDNQAFLGPASELNIAEHIFRSRGPSGCNREYLYLLADSLRDMGADDPHVYQIETYLKQMENDQASPAS